MRLKERKQKKDVIVHCLAELEEKQSLLSQYAMVLDILSSIEINEIKHHQVRRLNARCIRRTWETVGRNMKEAIIQYGQR